MFFSYPSIELHWSPKVDSESSDLKPNPSSMSDQRLAASRESHFWMTSGICVAACSKTQSSESARWEVSFQITSGIRVNSNGIWVKLISNTSTYSWHSQKLLDHANLFPFVEGSPLKGSHEQMFKIVPRSCNILWLFSLCAIVNICEPGWRVGQFCSAKRLT